jgi:hypothetical protein
MTTSIGKLVCWRRTLSSAFGSHFSELKDVIETLTKGAEPIAEGLWLDMGTTNIHGHSDDVARSGH